MKKPIKKGAPKKAVKPLYTASIKILGKVHTSEGNSVGEVIANLKPTGTTKGMSVLSITKGDKQEAKILPSPQVFRLFSSSKMMREIALKQVAMRFGI